MDAIRRSAQQRRLARRWMGVAYRRRQLFWFTWIRLAVLTTALGITLLFDFVIRPEGGLPNVRGLYFDLLLGYAFAAASLAAAGFMRSDPAVAALQFTGDLLVTTGLFVVLVPSLGYDGAMAIVLPLFVLTTALACTYLERLQGAAFAAGGFLLQVLVHLLPHYWTRAVAALQLENLAEAGLPDVLRHLFVLMFTFHATAWLLASRAERIRTMAARLQGVSEDLAQLQAFHEHVVRSIRAGIVTTDDAGGITFANQAALDMLHASALDLAGRSLHEVLGWMPWQEEDRSEAWAGRIRRVEREAVLGGEPVVLAVSITRLQDRDLEPLGLLFVLEDVTGLRELEQEVRLKEKMAAIGEMAAGIAHEIRNPLASISGSIQILDRQLALPEDRRQLMSIVLKEARRLDDTIRAFLDFARPRDVRPRPFDLAELGRETLLLLSHSDEVLPGHELVAPDASARVPALGDADQIRQVLWNLCTNALKAMPEGGSLTVSTETIGAQACLRVSDTGTGMSPGMLGRVFEPLAGEFHGGTGLGLAIVYRIVKDHGGRISLDSAPGAGTRIEVRLPSPAAPAGGTK